MGKKLEYGSRLIAGNLFRCPGNWPGITASGPRVGGEIHRKGFISVAFCHSDQRFELSFSRKVKKKPKTNFFTAVLTQVMRWPAGSSVNKA